MAQLLSLASAFNPGHDLWIVPTAAESRWTLRLDWYLNFQIIRAGRHARPQKDAAVEQVLQEIEWSPPNPRLDRQSPLLVSCDGRLPARWVAVVPGSSKLSDWTESIEKIWRDLQQPTLKIFLPTGLQAGPFSEEWRKKVQSDDYSVVLDQDPVVQ